MPYLGNIPSPIILQDVLGNYNFDYGTLYIDSINNRVGIGTSSPSQQLEVNGSVKLFNGLVDGPQLVLSSSGYTDWYFDNNAGSLRAINGSTNRFTVSSSGNVGIGTGSPSGKLHIVDTNASYLFTSNSTSSYNTTFNMDNTGLDIGHNSALRSINFLTNSLDRMTITGAGNVGIGTSSPTSKLNIKGNAVLGAVGYLDGDTNNYSFSIQTNQSVGNYVNIYLARMGNAGMYLTQLTSQFAIGPNADGSSPYLAINNAGGSIGYVGIGTSSPSSTLHVYGAGASELFNNQIIVQSNQAYNTSPTAAILFRNNYTSGGDIAGMGAIGVGKENVTDANFAGFMAFGTRPAGGSVTERMRISSIGNVGIGTSSPDTILDARKTNASYWGQTTTNTWGGTLTPPQALAITNSQPNGYDPVLLFRQATSTGTIKTSGAIGLVGGSNWTDGNDATQYSNMYFAIRNTTGGLQEIMRFTVDGRVGIGTISPGYRLHVVESSGIAIYGSSSTNHGVYGISSSQYGVVGISTSGLGIFGQSSSSSGVYGSSSTGTGIYGLSTSNYGAYSQSTNNYGIYGRTLNSGFGGIIGYNHDTSKYAILGFSTNYAVYGAGDAYFSGALSKGSGSFNIPHPLPELSETHRLIHSFVESLTADNIYRGKIQLQNGQATVNIDTHVGMTEGTFSALNGNIQVFLQNESGWDLVRGSVTDNILTIISQNQSSTDTISWMVIGERQDQHMLDTQWTDEFGRPILEPLKEPEPDVALPPEPEVPDENS